MAVVLSASIGEILGQCAAGSRNLPRMARITRMGRGMAVVLSASIGEICGQHAAGSRNLPRMARITRMGRGMAVVLSASIGEIRGQHAAGSRNLPRMARITRMGRGMAVVFIRVNRRNLRSACGRFPKFTADGADHADGTRDGRGFYPRQSAKSAVSMRPVPEIYRGWRGSRGWDEEWPWFLSASIGEIRGQAPGTLQMESKF
jgi:hypothetical protein